MKSTRLLSVLLVIGCASASQNVPATPPTDSQSGYIRYFEGNGCSQNQKGEHTDAAGTRINFKTTSGFQNDEARSLRLLNVRAGAVIRIYDSPGGERDDDWTEVRTRRQVGDLCVETFERTYTSDDVQVTYHRDNGLDGKVSRSEVD